MTRAYYETASDLDKEKTVAEILNTAWKCSLTKMPVKYHLDYVIIRDDKIVGFCELKSPNYSLADFKRFGGFFISLDKFMNAKKMNEATGLPCFIVINALDGLWYATFHNANITYFKVKGRKDRNDWQDIEPCAVLDTEQFKLLKGKTNE
ncbi:hypothetical protein UFOVP263_18 [uncultured Caudovirales phage]|uniref:Uncharacterized protein n=1 Tax=uncultured Caudovirales phage TaxID=2100421 RepID=A0A6J5LGX0_9CAUD|nr:hypothetical protein UFOVP263_18 [uncultured Caudovirales phage]CAB4242110.1 hypothetical protein UFOVP91_45 [uncultured Caudovirales phage]